ncbi:hypothetical protein ACEUAI_13145 [Aeromonas veronii]
MTKLSKEELQKNSIDALMMIAMDADGKAEAVWKRATKDLFPDATDQEVEVISSKLYEVALKNLDSLRHPMSVEKKKERGLGAISTHNGVRHAK